MSDAQSPVLTIDKLVVRGPLDDPSSLEVVGTSTNRFQLDVRFLQDGLEDSNDPYCADPPKAERGNFVGGPVHLRDDAYEVLPVGSPYYGVHGGEGTGVWSAQFFLWDQPELRRLWLEFIREIQVDDLGAAPRDVRIGVEAVAVHGSSGEKRFFSAVEIVSGFPYEVGVLFVHGIGPHAQRKTMVHMGEPVLSFWGELIAGATRLATERIPLETRKLWRDDVVGNGALRNRQDFEGIRHAVDRFAKVPGGETENSSSEDPPFRTGLARVKDTLVSGHSDPRFPVSSLVRLSTVHKDGSMRESHVLMSEAWWTDKVIPYSFDDLRQWVTEALPTVAHLHGYGSWVAVRKLAATEGAWPYRLLCLVSASIHALAIPLRLLAIVLLQPVLYLVGLLQLIPLRPWQGAIAWVVDLLMGTVGQSHVLKTSPIRRSAVVRSVARNLEWMQENCEKIFVVAHSQGAEIARLVSQSRRWTQVGRWISLGPGILPLKLLEPEERYRTQGSRRMFDSILWVMLGIFCYLVFLRGWIGLPAQAEEMIGVALFWILLFQFGTLVSRCLNDPGYSYRWSTEAIKKWHNYYADHDPVSAGSLFPDRNKVQEYDTFAEYEVQNKGSLFTDHTTYQDNRVQFVAPLAAEIFDVAMGSDTLDAEFGDPKVNAWVPPRVVPPEIWEQRKRIVRVWLHARAAGFVVIAWALVESLWGTGLWTQWTQAFAAAWHTSEGVIATASALFAPVVAVANELWLVWFAFAGYLAARALIQRWLLSNEHRLMSALSERLASKGRLG